MRPSALKAVAVATLAAIALVAGPGARAATELKLATIAPEKSVWADMLRRSIERVETASKGELKIIPYWSGQLGDQGETANMMLRGRIDIWQGPAPTVAMLAEDTLALTLPYLFDDYDHMGCVMPKVRADLDGAIAPKGRLLALIPVGWIDLAANGEVRLPGDVEGKRLRTGAQKITTTFWEGVGAQAVPLPAIETNQALATKMVWGAETALAFYNAVATYDVAPWYVNTHGYFNAGGVVMANRTWDKLTPDQRTIVTEAFSDDFGDLLKELADNEAMIRGKLEEKGVRFVDFTEAEAEVWRKTGRDQREALLAQTAPSTQALFGKVAKAADECRR